MRMPTDESTSSPSRTKAKTPRYYPVEVSYTLTGHARGPAGPMASRAPGVECWSVQRILHMPNVIAPPPRCIVSTFSRRSDLR